MEFACRSISRRGDGVWVGACLSSSCRLAVLRSFLPCVPFAAVGALGCVLRECCLLRESCCLPAAARVLIRACFCLLVCPLPARYSPLVGQSVKVACLSLPRPSARDCWAEERPTRHRSLQTSKRACTRSRFCSWRSGRASPRACALLGPTRLGSTGSLRRQMSASRHFRRLGVRGPRIAGRPQSSRRGWRRCFGLGSRTAGMWLMF